MAALLTWPRSAECIRSLKKMAREAKYFFLMMPTSFVVFASDKRRKKRNSFYSYFLTATIFSFVSRHYPSLFDSLSNYFNDGVFLA